MRYRCSLTRSLLPDLLFGFVLCTAVTVVMSGAAEFHKDQGQDREDECLDETDEQLEWDEYNARDDRQQEGKDCEQRAACEDVAKETEGERDDATQFTDDLEQAHDEIDNAHRELGEQRLEVQVLADLLARAQVVEAEALRHDNRDDGHSQRQIQVGGRGSNPGDNRVRDVPRQEKSSDRLTMSLVNRAHIKCPDGIYARDDIEQIAGHDKDKERSNERKELSALFLARNALHQSQQQLYCPFKEVL